jgi:hypothetical protein
MKTAKICLASLIITLLLFACQIPGGPASRAEVDRSADLEQDLTSVTIGFSAGDSADRVTGDIVLPVSGANGSSLAWASSDESVIASDGTVIRPANLSADRTVRLTVTASLGSSVASRDFDLTVLQSWQYEPVPAVNPESGVLAGALAQLNYYRWRVGLDPLVWNQTLADQAQARVETFEAPTHFIPDPNRAENSGFDTVGEIFYFRAVNYSIGIQAVNIWASYCTNYEYGTPYEAGFYPDYSKYTQLVWAETTDFGIGYVQNGGYHYVLARFGVSGNIEGEVPYGYSQRPWLDLDNDGVIQYDDADDTDREVQ